jgi:hypothetical protein
MQEKAFPNPHLTSETGMTMRDYFAAKALVASYPKVYEMFLEDIFDDWHGDGIESLAREAYLIADAMMKAREA